MKSLKFNAARHASLFLAIFFTFIMLSRCSNDDNNPTGPSDNNTLTVKDVDGNSYKTVKIGNQVWMAENLRVTRYRNGEAIPHVTDKDAWAHLSTDAYCDYDNDEAHVATYGRLYNWYAVNDPRGLAPSGWHVPSDAEWKQLEIFLGMSQSEADDTSWRGSDEGGKLKESGTAHWESPNTGAASMSGFTALPGGYRSDVGNYDSIGYGADFWSSTDNDWNLAWYRILLCNYADINRGISYKRNGFSVRCVKD